jgi:dihydroorotase
MEQGSLQEGKPADLVIFDPEETWEVKDFKSKASNSPFTGWTLKGKVKYTICDGNIVYQD